MSIIYTRARRDFDGPHARELETFVERSPLGRSLVWREVLLNGTAEQCKAQLARYNATRLAVRDRDPRKEFPERIFC